MEAILYYGGLRIVGGERQCVRVAYVAAVCSLAIRCSYKLHIVALKRLMTAGASLY